MCLKRERTETDDFKIKQISGCEGKILRRNFNISRNEKFFTIFPKMSLHILAFQNVPSIFNFFPYENLNFLSAQELFPP